MGAFAYALPPPLQQPSLVIVTQMVFTGMFGNVDSHIAMRPLACWVQGWRKGVDHFAKKKFFTEQPRSL